MWIIYCRCFIFGFGVVTPLNRIKILKLKGTNFFSKSYIHAWVWAMEKMEIHTTGEDYGPSSTSITLQAHQTDE